MQSGKTITAVKRDIRYQALIIKRLKKGEAK